MLRKFINPPYLIEKGVQNVHSTKSKKALNGLIGVKHIKNVGLLVSQLLRV